MNSLRSQAAVVWESPNLSEKSSMIFYSRCEGNIGVLALEEDLARTTSWYHVGGGKQAVTLGRGHASGPASTVLGEPHWEQDVTTYLTIGGQRRLITSSPVFATWQKHLDCQVRHTGPPVHRRVSSQESGDERKAIDEIMTKLRTLVAETGICLFLVSHLRRSQGKAHEDGAQISLGELRGSTGHCTVVRHCHRYGKGPAE